MLHAFSEAAELDQFENESGFARAGYTGDDDASVGWQFGSQVFVDVAKYPLPADKYGIGIPLGHLEK